MKIEDLDKWFESEEGKKCADEFVQKLILKEEQKKEFELNDQPNVMEMVHTILKEEGMIDSEQILYIPEKYPFSSEEFYLLFNTLESYAIRNNSTFSDPTCPFPNHEFHITYRETKIIFHCIVGQGTTTWITLCSEGKWNVECNFDYDEYRFKVVE